MKRSAVFLDFPGAGGVCQAPGTPLPGRLEPYLKILSPRFPLHMTANTGRSSTWIKACRRGFSEEPGARATPRKRKRTVDTLRIVYCILSACGRAKEQDVPYRVLGNSACTIRKEGADETVSGVPGNRPGGRFGVIPVVRQRDGCRGRGETRGKGRCESRFGHRIGGADLRADDGAGRDEGPEARGGGGPGREMLRVPRRDPGAQKRRQAREGQLHELP